MKHQQPGERNENRTDSTARRQNEGLPGLWYLFFGRRKGMRRHEDNQKSYFSRPLCHSRILLAGI